MPEDCLEGGLLSWEMERRGARPLLAAELLLWAGDGLGLGIYKKIQFVQCCFIYFKVEVSRQFKSVFVLGKANYIRPQLEKWEA